MDLLRRVSNPLELEKLIQQLYVAKNKGSVDFSNLTNTQTKQIANAINNITGFAVRLNTYNLNSNNISRVPFKVTSPDLGDEVISVKDTQGTEVKFFPFGSNPYVIKGGDLDLSSFNGTGKYLRVFTQINNNNYQLLFGNNSGNTFKDFNFGTYNTGAYFQISVENFGSPLQRATPYNIRIENNITEDFNLKMYAEYAIQVLNKPQTQDYYTNQWQNWDYVYPYWSINLSGINKNVKFELFALNAYGTPGNTQLIGNGYAYSNGNYPGDNWLNQIDQWNGYNTRDYKIVVSYF